MLLSDLTKLILVTTGQYLSGDLTRLRLDYDQWWPLVQNELTMFEQYMPITKRFNIQVTPASDPSYDFTTDPNNEGQDLQAMPQELGLPPQWISKCTPVGSSQMMANWASSRILDQIPGTLGRLIIPRTVIKVYRKPVLYISENGTFDVKAHYHHFCKVTKDGDDKITEVEIIGLENSQGYNILTDMICGRFLVTVGRARRAFVHNELAITTDAADLVREGIDMLDAATKLLYERGNWHDSIRI